MLAEGRAKEAAGRPRKEHTSIQWFGTLPQEALVALDVARISDPEQLAALAPVLTELQNARLRNAPHCRPIAPAELGQAAASDKRFAERAILVARRGERVVGWCHVEPPGTARTAGDVYPYVGGEVVFQSGLPFHEAVADGEEIIRALLYAALQAQAQQGQSHLELLAPEDCGAEGALRAQGMQPADKWATYVSPMSEGPVGRGKLTVRSLAEAELSGLPALLAELGVLAGEFTDDDFRQLRRRFPDFEPDGLLVAVREDEAVGYAAVMIDSAYTSATGRSRAWLGLGPLGIGVRRVPEHASWLAVLVNAAHIVAARRGAQELAIVASLDSRDRSFWERLGFQPEVRWRRWRADV
jgi:hypothetical protein